MLSNQEIEKQLLQFKQFINQRPQLIKAIRKNEDLLQKYFEKWVDAGPDDSYWKELTPSESNEINDTIKDEAETTGQTDFVRQLTNYLDKFNIEKIEDHMGSLNKTIQLVQDFIGNFKTDEHAKTEKTTKRPIHHLRD